MKNKPKNGQKYNIIRSSVTIPFVFTALNENVVKSNNIEFYAVINKNIDIANLKEYNNFINKNENDAGNVITTSIPTIPKDLPFGVQKVKQLE